MRFRKRAGRRQSMIPCRRCLITCRNVASNTIKCLNQNQAAALICFRGDGTGQRVLWELVTEADSDADSESLSAVIARESRSLHCAA